MLPFYFGRNCMCCFESHFLFSLWHFLCPWPHCYCPQRRSQNHSKVVHVLGPISRLFLLTTHLFLFSEGWQTSTSPQRRIPTPLMWANKSRPFSLPLPSWYSNQSNTSLGQSDFSGFVMVAVTFACKQHASLDGDNDNDYKKSFSNWPGRPLVLWNSTATVGWWDRPSRGCSTWAR